MKEELSSFAQTIFRRSYAIHPDETWNECARRVATVIAGDRKELVEEFYEAISQRKFVPAGRYLYSCGREIQQLNNCFIFIAEDSRDGWAELLKKHVLVLSTGGGAGTVYSNIRGKGQPIKRFGGYSSGPLSLMMMVNEVARHVMAGGSRRSALWSGLNWQHPDIEDFIKAKDWSTHVKALKESDFNFPANLDMTNISVCLDDEFFAKMKKDSKTKDFYYRVCRSMCKSGEPGLSINIGKNSEEIGRNPCQPNWATILTPDGIRNISDVDVGDSIWSGKKWTKITKKWSTGVKDVYKYITTRGVFYGTEEHRVVEGGIKKMVKDVKYIDSLPGPSFRCSNLNPVDTMDGLVLGDGSVHKASNNLVHLYVGSKDQDYFQSEIKDLLLKYRPGLSEGAWEIETTILSDELPKTYEREVPERFYRGNSNKIKGFLRGLFSANGSAISGYRIILTQSSKKLIYQVAEMLSSIGIASYITISKPSWITFKNGTYLCKQSYILNISDMWSQDSFIKDIGFIQKYKQITKSRAYKAKVSSPVMDREYCGKHEVFDFTVDNKEHTYWTGGCLVSNCTEVTSSLNNDCCNLGSINLSRISDIEELKKITRLAVKFLYLGSYKSWLPHSDIEKVRDETRRIGLGVMGIHHWLLQRGYDYEPNGELGKWLAAWEAISDSTATKFAKEMGGIRPVAVRAIAPNGTTSILAETSSGVEPIYCTSYKRRFLGNNGKWQYSYVIDPTVENLVKEQGIDPNSIEDSISLAPHVERRIQFQAFVQDFVDQGIAVTINLPEYGDEGNNNVKRFAETLLRYLPRLRGITVYPDGARSGQPLTKVKYETAISKSGVVFEESEEKCSGGVCGI